MNLALSNINIRTNLIIGIDKIKRLNGETQNIEFIVECWVVQLFRIGWVVQLSVLKLCL